MILGSNCNHTHGEIDTRSVERQRIRQGCKRKATEEPSERPSKIIINEIQKTNPAEILPQDIASVRQYTGNAGKLSLNYRSQGKKP
jgi:hypothetical protein